MACTSPYRIINRIEDRRCDKRPTRSQKIGIGGWRVRPPWFRTGSTDAKGG
jgi:hypothetical protein